MCTSSSSDRGSANRSRRPRTSRQMRKASGSCQVSGARRVPRVSRCLQPWCCALSFLLVSKTMPFVSPLRFGLVVAIASLLLCYSMPSRACTPGKPTEDVWNTHVVFVGTALERTPAPDRQMATRYRVHASNQLDSGEEVTIFVAQNSCSGGTHPVGMVGIVIARDEGQVLTTDSTITMTREERRAVLSAFGLRSDFVTRSVVPSSDYPACERPKTIAQAFDASDAVWGARVYASCLNRRLHKVESVVHAHSIYKGPPISNWYIMLHQPEYYRERTKVDREFTKKYQRPWPPAEFLREIPNLTGAKTKTYLHNMCLTPVPPHGSSLDVSVELNSHFPRPAPQVSTGETPPLPRPTLSCSTLGKDMVWKAKAHLKAHKKKMKSKAIPTLKVMPPIEKPPPIKKPPRPTPRKKEFHLGGAGGASPSTDSLSRRGADLGGASGQQLNKCEASKSGCASCSQGARSAPAPLSLLFGVLLLGFASHRRSSRRS